MGAAYRTLEQVFVPWSCNFPAHTIIKPVICWVHICSSLFLILVVATRKAPELFWRHSLLPLRARGALPWAESIPNTSPDIFFFSIWLFYGLFTFGWRFCVYIQFFINTPYQLRGVWLCLLSLFVWKWDMLLNSTTTNTTGTTYSTSLVRKFRSTHSTGTKKNQCIFFL